MRELHLGTRLFMEVLLYAKMHRNYVKCVLDWLLVSLLYKKDNVCNIKENIGHLLTGACLANIYDYHIYLAAVTSGRPFI